jgi:hypothetical protein
MDEESERPQELSRRSFITTSAGVATGAAIVAAPAAIAVNSADSPKKVHKPSATPSEPIMAYVRDAKRGEVTVLSGTGETTYRDPVLVERLLAAAEPQVSLGTGWGH